MSTQVQVTPPPTSRSFIPGLDGIRALAVMTIFVFHAEVMPHVPGELATTTFFFLSGFLITTLFIKEWRKTGDINLGGFYYRRALRTLPPLWIALGLALFANLALHVGDPITPWKVGGNFLNYTNYALAFSGDRAGFLPGMVLLWSLAVDEHYYLVFAPLLKAGLKRISMAAIMWVIVGLCVAALAWRIYLMRTMGELTFRQSMASDTRMDSILFGALLAFWRNPALDPDKARSLARPWLVALGFAGLIGVYLCHNPRITDTVGYTIQGLSMIPIFTMVILQGGKGWLKFLQWPWVLWISRASYPLYLLQWLMLMTCYRFVHAPHAVQVLCALAATFVLGAGMHYAVEQPLARLRKRSKVVQPMPRALETQVAIPQPANA